MKAVVVGSGGWGTALSMVLCDNGHDVTLWSHDPAKAAEMAKTNRAVIFSSGNPFKRSMRFAFLIR